MICLIRLPPLLEYGPLNWGGGQESSHTPLWVPSLTGCLVLLDEKVKSHCGYL